jgi:16S rRNA (uracil1498-N3)-methyltransferase
MNKNKSVDVHEFAFFYPETTHIGTLTKVGALCTIDDRVLCHRVMHVLRLLPGATFILFDAHKHMACTLQSVSERRLQATVNSYECNVCYAPHITFLLPLLKREAFEESLYALTELGVNTIQFVMTKKSQRSWGDQKELERAERIIQAAAEQSKNFALPKVNVPVSLEEAVGALPADATKIFFDPEGCRIGNVVSSVQTSINTRLVLCVGPEGDLTAEEKSYLDEHGFIFCQLTPTILRAQQAVTVSVGMLRSWLRL